MPSASYSKAVLIGLQKHGISVADAARITALTPDGIQAVLRETSSFSDDHLALIERATGLTAGQLAMLSSSISDDKIASIMETWAAARNDMPALTTANG